ncbi:MAG: hypothetical protein ABIK12_03500 [Pseudomonadota bacterium]
MAGPQAQMPLPWQSADVRLPLKLALRRALKNSGLSREQFMDAFNEEMDDNGIDYKLTLSTLEKWVAPSAGNMIPSHLVTPFCKISKSTEPLAVQLAPLGYAPAGPRELELIRLAEAKLRAKEAARIVRETESALERMK